MYFKDRFSDGTRSTTPPTEKADPSHSKGEPEESTEKVPRYLREQEPEPEEKTAVEEDNGDDEPNERINAKERIRGKDRIMGKDRIRGI